MTPSISKDRDGIETAILLALHAKNRESAKRFVARTALREYFDLGVFCPDKPEFPRFMYGFDASSSSRLYSASMADIVVDPVRAIGRGLEIAVLCADGTLKWAKVKPMARPRNLIAISNGKVEWFAYHFRTIREGEPDTYSRRPIALSDGKLCLVKPLELNGFNSETFRSEMSEQLAMTLSIFEDAIRAGSMLATVQEHAALAFPIGQDGYLSYLRLRDGHRDTPTGRRNPILHWCREHLRSRNDKIFEVRAHDRGAEEFVVGPMTLTIERNEGYGPFTADPAHHGENQ